MPAKARLPRGKKTGRPTKLTPELAEEICRRLSRESITAVFADPEMPERTSFYNWLLKDADFFNASARARAIAALREMDEAEQQFTGEKVDVALLRERLQHSRWKVSKLLPKNFGDRLDLTSGGDKLASGVLVVPGVIAAGEWAATAAGQQRKLEQEAADAAERAGGG